MSTISNRVKDIFRLVTLQMWFLDFSYIPINYKMIRESINNVINFKLFNILVELDSEEGHVLLQYNIKRTLPKLGSVQPPTSKVADHF